jgi:putative ABC transport system ATP-binding protein
MEGSN